MNKEYVEVILEGSLDLIKGFVIGFLEGRGIAGEAVFEEDQGLREGESFNQLLRYIHLKENRVHLMVGAGVHELLTEALKNRAGDIPIKIISVRKIKEARFEFRYRTYSRSVGEELKRLFQDLPGGVAVKGDPPREVVRPEAKGIEAYAPEHEYEIDGAGMAKGPAKEVIDFYGRLSRYELMELGEIGMEFETGNA